MGSDTKRLITGMVVAFALLLGWNAFMRWHYRDYYEIKITPFRCGASLFR